MNTYDVVLPGAIFCDLIFTGLPELPLLGQEVYASGFDVVPGGIFITAVALRRLGLQPGIVCPLGDDIWGRFIDERLAAEELDTGLVQRVAGPYRHISVALSFPHDRSFISFADPQPPLLPPARMLEDVDFRHMHLSGLGCAVEQLDLLALARRRGATVSISCQWCPKTMGDPRVRQVIDQADIFIPNHDEALLLTGAANTQQALEVLADWAPHIALTCGPAGALGAEGSARYAVEALPVDAIDTTGAGDSFAAGLIYAYLQGKPFDEALRYGVVCGSLSTTARGGATAAPWLEEVEQRIMSLAAARKTQQPWPL